MKIRIRGNAIRLRLSKSDIALFAKAGLVEEQTHFADSTLVYAIKTARQPAMTAFFTNGNLTVYLPEKDAMHWLGTDLVGIEAHMPVEGRQPLHILVEKDFKCIDASETEDQADFYENPVKTC